jgi:putative sugar O-methyltransferase
MKIKDEWLVYENMIDENDSEFLSQSAVQGTMFQSDTTLFLREFDYIREYNAEYLELMQDPTDYGSPLVFEVDNNTYNPNDIHHLYHVCRYENRVGKPDQKIDILEWGGGYGNMCKVLHTVYQDLIGSYTIVDLPKFSRLAKNYVEETCVNANVKHLDVTTFENEISDKYDMFLSTWALSESPSSWTDYLNEKSFFDASRILVSLHQCGDHIPFMKESTYLREVLNKYDTVEQDVSVIDGVNFYVFK